MKRMCFTLACAQLLALAGPFNMIRLARGASAATGAEPKLHGLPSVADSLIRCDFETPAVKSGCKVQAYRLQGPQDFEMDFAVTYEYLCTGNAIDVVLRTDRQSSPPLERGLGKLTVSIAGRDYLDIEAANPAATYSTYLSASCRLNVLSVEAAPSRFTVEFWREYARLLSESLRDKLGLWKLASSLQRILDWDDGQLLALKPAIDQSIDIYLREQGSSLDACRTQDGKFKPRGQMPQEWHRAADAHPEMIDFVTILDYVEDTIAGRPPVTVPHDVSEAAVRSRQTLVAHFLGELMIKQKEALALRDRIVAAKQQATLDLSMALQEVEIQMHKSTLVFCEMEPCK